MVHRVEKKMIRKTATRAGKPRAKSNLRPHLDRALADLERELRHSAAPAGTSGQVDTPLVVALAKVIAAYGRLHPA